MNEKPGPEPPAPVVKRPYTAPRLAVYGDLHVITMATRKRGNDSSGISGSDFSM